MAATRSKRSASTTRSKTGTAMRRTGSTMATKRAAPRKRK